MCNNVHLLSWNFNKNCLWEMFVSFCGNYNSQLFLAHHAEIWSNTPINSTPYTPHLCWIRQRENNGSEWKARASLGKDLSWRGFLGQLLFINLKIILYRQAVAFAINHHCFLDKRNKRSVHTAVYSYAFLNSFMKL